MKNKINVSSMLIGIALGAITVLGVAATTSSSPSPSLTYGRFQLIAADQFLFKIDTSTGQVWKSLTGQTSKEFMATNIEK